MKVGDKVKVVNPGRTYDLYEDLAQQLGLTSWRRHICPKYGDIGTITVKTLHPHNGRSICVVLINQDEFIMGEDGVQLHPLVLGAQFMLGNKDE